MLRLVQAPDWLGAVSLLWLACVAGKRTRLQPVLSDIDMQLSRRAAQLGQRCPALNWVSVAASLGADEDVGAPCYLAGGLAGTLFSWSLVSAQLGISRELRACLRGVGNLGLDMVMVWVLTCLIESTIKLFVRRARPSLRTKASLPGDIYSFPSGHTMRAFYYYLPFLFHSRYVHALCGQLSSKLAPVALLCALLTGFSRVARLRHWPSDVLAGSAIGCAFGWSFETAAQETRLQAFFGALVWATLVAVAQYSASVRRSFNFGTSTHSAEWTLFVVVSWACFWLYTDVSVQGSVTGIK